MSKVHWQDWASACVGAWLFASPFVLGAENSAVAWNFWIVGVAIALLALSEISVFNRMTEWAIAALGTWMLLSPRLMDFSNETAIWNAAICGLLAVAFAGWAIGDAHEILPRRKRRAGDLRGDMPSMSLPDEHEHMAGARVHRPDAGPDVLTPGVNTQSPGQVSHG